MSEKQLRGMIAYASSFCEKRFAKTGMVEPLWHAVTAKGDTLIEQSPCDDLSVLMIRALFDLADVVRYVFIDEAWTLNRMLRSDEEERVRTEGISKHPDRVEIVMIQGEDREAGLITMHRNIIRPAKGKPYLGPLLGFDDLPFIPQDAGVAQSEGRMVGLLPVRGARH